MCSGDGSYRPVVSSPHFKSAAVAAVLAAIEAGRPPEKAALRDAVRALLSELSRSAPGRSVEVRVPPYGAVQCGAGPRHTRGTPPNVVETDPVTWVCLATGRLAWVDATADGRVRVSGSRADISGYFPV
nr:sterol carrier family protein [Polymorphospora rubra]